MVRLQFSWKKICLAVLVLVVVVAVGVTSLLLHPKPHGRLRLPVGKGNPAISLSQYYGLILASDGSLWSWGGDRFGLPVLGLTGLTNRSPSLRRIGTDTNWARISAGTRHALAIKSDGTLWTWGWSMHAYNTMPTVLAASAPALAAPGADWKEVAAGDRHSLALKQDGTLWGWGYNWAGGLGIAPTNGSASPLPIGSDTNWIKVWAGEHVSMAMKTDHSLWCWGEFTNPDPNAPAGPITTPTRFSPETNWVDAGFAGDTVFALKSDGSLWVWGDQAQRFTQGRTVASNAIPARVGTNSDWKAISATAFGWRAPGLVKKDGSLWLMEASDSHKPAQPYPPVRFHRAAYQGDYAACAAHAQSALWAPIPGLHLCIGVAVKADGEVWTWGLVLGEPPTLGDRAREWKIRLLNRLPFRKKTPPPYPPPPFVFRQEPWQLRNE